MSARWNDASDAEPAPPDLVLLPMTTSQLDAVMAIESAAYAFPWTRGNFIDSIAARYPARLLYNPAGELLGYFVAMLGVDSPSTDYGSAPGFAVHGVLGAANVPALENLADLSALPRVGALLMALPIKTRGGSGGPVRVLALIAR